MSNRPLISICVPAYNRSRFLKPLLDSIFSQNFNGIEVVICEDCSPERRKIASIVKEYQCRHPNIISYYENSENLGYDGNIRNLVDKATGVFCFFLGNDDLICDGAFVEVARIISAYPNVGMVLKSYQWFEGEPHNIHQTVRYFSSERQFQSGKEAIVACTRRSGVISGYIINRDAAYEASTTIFDGSLFYQMHLTATVLVRMSSVFTPTILVSCRNGEPPEFGNSEIERTNYVPGSFTAQARLNMVGGVLAIVRRLKEVQEVDVIDEIMRDYANHFYACIRDQLDLSIPEYWKLYREFSRMKFYKYPMFHLYFFVARLLGQKHFDWLIRKSQKTLGRSINFS